MLTIVMVLIPSKYVNLDIALHALHQEKQRRLNLTKPSEQSLDSSILHVGVEQKESIWTSLKTMKSNKQFVFMVLSLSSIYFIITNIQFWMSDYMMVVLGASEQTVFIAFTFICVTSPTLGSVLSGWLGYYMGGYQSRHALPLCIGLAFICLVLGIPVPFIDSYLGLAVMIWLYLFVGGIFLPILTGTMLSSVDPSLRP